jgi:hypothetical protein
MTNEREAGVVGRQRWASMTGFTLPHFFMGIEEINTWVIPTPDGGIGR